MCGGRSFLLRVAGNLRLLRKLGYYERERGDIVVSIGQQVVQNIGQGPVRPTGVDLGQIVGQRFSVLPF